jgi:5''-deoxy-5''-methylthioadenosine phosphorylase
LSKYRADIGVFGGTGFYEFLTNVKEIWIETPYGAPSDKVALGEVGGKRVAFLPRHGKDHRIPPHLINYRANLWAMKELGVSRIIGPCAAGSLQPHIKPGDLVVTDQFVNRTWGRKDTFYEGPIVTHVSPADPYCPEMRALAIEAAKEEKINVHERGTVVVIQGPRFSTRAESQEYRSHGWEVINMTQYPEGYLARELGICYVNIALITDYDVGTLEHPEPVSHEAVMIAFKQNIEKLQKVLFRLIEKVPVDERACQCADALKSARG